MLCTVQVGNSSLRVRAGLQRRTRVCNELIYIKRICQKYVYLSKTTVNLLAFMKKIFKEKNLHDFLMTNKQKQFETFLLYILKCAHAE